MRFSSQICTTKEQSERLIALGLKKQTADCFHWNAYGRNYIGNIDDEELNPDDVPAWSLNRLMEISGASKMIFNLDLYDSPYEEIICRIERFINFGEFNKEFLE
jgi:hypothetical protein